jgi:hypothetical protein
MTAMPPKKLFVLASVTTLGGVVSVVSLSAGCSSTIVSVVETPTDGGLTDAKGTKKDGSGTSSGDPEDDSGSSGGPVGDTCKDTSTAFTATPFNPAATQTVACTATVINALADACPLNADPNTTASCTSARALAANKTCAECIYGVKTDTKDKPITLTPGVKPGFQLNQHICFDHFTKVPGCGAQFINAANCFDNYCDLVENGGKCTSDAEVSSCIKVVRDAECKQHLITDQACGEGVQNAKICFPAANTAAAYKQFYVDFTTQACATQ